MLRISPPSRPGLLRCGLASSSYGSRSSLGRSLHTSGQRPSPPVRLASAQANFSALNRSTAPSPAPSINPPPALSILPLSSILRSLMTTTVSAAPLLLGPSMAIMNVLAHSTTPLLNPDKNALLRFFLKKTFYAQFCAGENPVEVRRTIDNLKSIGFSGVILCYAKEVVMSSEDKKNLAAAAKRADANAADIKAWAEGTLETVRLATAGDFVALKFSGAGVQALHHLTERLPPAPALADAIDAICQLAVERGVRLLFDAEQHAVQAGIDDWTLACMKKYNTKKDASGEMKAVVYGTYQAYLKQAPSVLSSHLRMARDGGFALGVKLVRGAYLGSDPRHLIHDTKEDTDACYDGLAEAILRREWRAPLDASEKAAFPPTDLVVASHNSESTRRAQAILASGQAKTTDVAFGQLQGMADEVSCKLVVDAKAAAAASSATGAAPAMAPVRAYKYLVWGSTGECMKYLLRRAQENRDAVQRTKSSRDAMWEELVRRTRAVLRLA